LIILLQHKGQKRFQRQWESLRELNTLAKSSTQKEWSKEKETCTDT
jgi:hypothetical protein